MHKSIDIDFVTVDGCVLAEKATPYAQFYMTTLLVHHHVVLTM